MVKDAEKYAAEDQVRKNRVEVVNQAESVVHDIEKNMEEYKDQLPKEDADKMREDIAKLREKLARKDEETPEAIKEATGEVQKSALENPLSPSSYKDFWIVPGWPQGSLVRLPCPSASTLSRATM